MKKEPVIVQQEDKPIPVEILAQSLIDLDKAAKRIEAAGLSRRAIALLLWDAIPASNTPSRSQIELVLAYLPRLVEIHGRKKKP